MLSFIEMLDYHAMWLVGTFLACIIAGFCMRMGIKLITKIENTVLNRVLFFGTMGICIPGIIIHEAGHMLMCWAGRVKIKNFALLEILEDEKGHFAGLGGHVESYPHSNVIAKLGIFIGPALLNGFVMLVCWVLYPFFVQDWGIQFLLGYLIISCGIGCMPSLADVSGLLYLFNKNLRDGLLTIIILSSAFIGFYYLSFVLGLFVSLLLTFLPSITLLAYLSKKQHDREELERKKKLEIEKRKQRQSRDDNLIQDKIRKLNELVNDNDDSRSIINDSEW